MMGGGDGDHEGHHHQGGEGGGESGERPPACSAEQAQAALEASSDYVTCSGLAYKDFMSLVHADFDLLEQASACFATTVQEMEHDEPDEKGEIVVDLGEVFEACVEQVEAADEARSTEATTEFLNSMLGPDSKICTCLPAYVDKMPLCDLWARYHHLGMRIEQLSATEVRDVDPNAVIEVKDSSSSQGARLPNTFGPCPPGEEVHPSDATQCQPAQTQNSEGGYGGPQGKDGNGGPPEGGGIVGLGMSVVAVVAMGSLIGFGGVWIWGKFQSGTRQPGVRYMATGAVDNDIGTELGPFGREYA
eukprot:jgi/Undpi1/1747/HiC_scaffold_11.g05136.m1